VLLIGLCGTGISCLLFGFSKWYWWALLSRFLFGINGNLGVAKTYLREVCDETNQSKAFSYVLNASFSTSMISKN
jgi:MFS family permease